MGEKSVSATFRFGTDTHSEFIAVMYTGLTPVPSDGYVRRHPPDPYGATPRLCWRNPRIPA